MKQIRWLMVVFTGIMILGAIIIVVKLKPGSNKENKEYLVEVNRIYQEIQDYCKEQVGKDHTLESQKTIDLSDKDFLSQNEYSYVKALSYYKPSMEDEQGFFEGKKAKENCVSYFLPLSEEETGYSFIRFEYIKPEKGNYGVQYILLFVTISMWLLTMIVLVFVQVNILRPFHKIEQLPYELSKGHLNIELKENKYRYFGKFIWGLDALRETLKNNRSRQLMLEKEKKMLILSVSHDIKTPLSSIYLYNKALREGLYEEGKKQEIYDKLQQKAEQIESFVAEIEKMSTENILELPVTVKNCYIKEAIEPIEAIYKEKLELYHTHFVIDSYPNKLVKADKDRVIEVIENLLENAIKYGDGKSITISSTEEDYCLLITVSNSGLPVEEKDFPHLFESFWRGSNSGQQRGSGLGLYICKELMLKMDGDIYATRNEKGMSFTLVLREA